MADHILLNYSILGHGVQRTFGIWMSPREAVDDLKDVIKADRVTTLAHIRTAELDIWKASDHTGMHRTNSLLMRHTCSSRILFPAMKSSIHLGVSSTVQTSQTRFSLNLWRSCHFISLHLQCHIDFIWLYKSPPPVSMRFTAILCPRAQGSQLLALETRPFEF